MSSPSEVRPAERQLVESMSQLHAPAAAAMVMATKVRDEDIARCRQIATQFHELMMKQKPGSKGALRYAHLSEGALACAVHLAIDKGNAT
jgi:hypothetical protein